MIQISEILNKAAKFYEQEDFKSALKYAEKILKYDSKNASALVIRGNVYHQKQQPMESLECYLQALENEPNNLVALINAANSYYEFKDYAKAYQLSKQALEQDSLNKVTLTIFGNSALELEKFDESKQAFFQLLKLDSSDVWSYNSLSQIYQKTHDNNRAVAHGWKAIEVSNGAKEQHINFSYLLYEIGGKIAQEYASKWLEKYGDNQIVNHMAQAILNYQNLKRADGEYVQEIFDSFADDFEEVLKGLEYNAPNLIKQEMEKIYSLNKSPKLRILDAGCGTGLCGVFLKKYAISKGLIGVDISAKMLEKAAAKKCYNKLIKKDLETYFNEEKKKFDLIVFADVLTYFGNLKNIVKGCQNLLQKNGKILLTFSKNNINKEDYYLHTSGRFLHHEKYVKNLLEKEGFFIEKMEENFLRNEGENKVMGYLVSAIKNA